MKGRIGKKIKIAYMAGVIESGSLVFESVDPIFYHNRNYDLLHNMRNLYYKLLTYKEGLVKWYHILLLLHSYYAGEITHEELITGAKVKQTRRLEDVNMRIAYAIGANTFILNGEDLYYSLPYFQEPDCVKVKNLKDIIKVLEMCEVRNNKVNSLVKEYYNINTYEVQK